MNQTPLQRAIACLRIADIWQHSVTASISEELEAQERFPENPDTLYKHIVVRSLWGGTEGDSGPFVFRVYIAVGVRFVDKSGDSVGEDSAADHDKPGADGSVLAQIEATYVAQYHSDTDPGQDALEAFALQNASYHVWPYWREFLASQCARMNLPRLSLPLQSLAGNHGASRTEAS